MSNLPRHQASFQSYISLLDAYGVVPESEREKLRRTGTTDPARRREEKIAQFRWEKDIREKLKVGPTRTWPLSAAPFVADADGSNAGLCDQSAKLRPLVDVGRLCPHPRAPASGTFWIGAQRR
jgi:hypothetical protein